MTTKPTLTASDPPDWYECTFNNRRECHYWDGEKLIPSPDFHEGGPFPLDWFTDFRRLVYEPTPQPGVAELVAENKELLELLKWADGFIERCKGGATNYTEYSIRMHAGVKSVLRKALAAVEAAGTNQERINQ